MYDGIPQELDFQQGSGVITVSIGRRLDACSYWWRMNRVVADGRTFAVWLAGATGVEALLRRYPASRTQLERTCGLTDDRPTWWLRDITDEMMLQGVGTPGSAGLSVVAARPFEFAENRLATAAQQEAELLRLASNAIVAHLS